MNGLDGKARRMRTGLLRVAAALAVLGAMLTSVTAASAGGSSTVKILVLDAAPRQIIAVFQGARIPGSLDPGFAQVRSTTPVTLGSRVTELFVPVGMVSAIWLWEERTGYRFLANVAPGSLDRPITLNAGRDGAEPVQTHREISEPAQPVGRSTLAKGGGTAKILIFNAMRGEVITAFEGAYVPSPESTDPGIGQLESTTPAAIDSKVTELFVPVGMASAIWIWHEMSSYRFVANVAPGDPSTPIQLDARTPK